ncbi:hypothetical protein [Zoogloea sp.]|uniref:hypothetical protein n=1 Tax=Zoogloea sp. TaxID=49181 RepID=UPI0035AFD29E
MTRVLSPLMTRLLAGGFLALVGSTSALACNTPKDEWGGNDKAKHFAVSAALGAGATRLDPDPWIAFGLALAPGVAKEVYDSTRDCNRFSWRDLAWDAVGAAVGVHLGNWVLGPSSVSYVRSF